MWCLLAGVLIVAAAGGAPKASAILDHTGIGRAQVESVLSRPSGETESYIGEAVFSTSLYVKAAYAGGRWWVWVDYDGRDHATFCTVEYQPPPDH